MCGVINVGFSACMPSSFFSGTIDPLFQQAAAQGQTVFVPSGDNGADQCGTNSRNINELAADPNVIAVGGTELSPLYDSHGRDSSVVKVGPDGDEFVWNSGGGATGGGVSGIFQRPSWQSNVDIPGNMRLIPDVSIGASPSEPGYLVIAFDPDTRVNSLHLAGGTSLASPAWSGISRLLAEIAGNTRLGEHSTPNLWP